jgi:NitT/TauT family transport system substrate-binding protein
MALRKARVFAVVLVALLWLLPQALAGSPEGVEQPQINVGYMPIAEETPKWVAYEEGFFKRHGLDARLVRFESGPDMVTALIGGSIQFGMVGTPGLINAALADRPIVAFTDNGSNVMGPQGYEYYTGLVVLAKSPIKTLGDLKGRTIAFNVLKANSETQTVMQVDRWNREHPDQRIDLNKDVRIVTIPFGSMPAALEKGIADAASMIEPYTTQLMMRQQVRVISPVAYAMPNWPVSVGIVRRDFAGAHPKTAAAYKAAWLDSVAWIGQHPGMAKQLVAKYAGVPQDVAQRLVMPSWGRDVAPVRSRLEQVMRAMQQDGMIQKTVDLSRWLVENPSAR